MKHYLSSPWRAVIKMLVWSECVAHVMLNTLSHTRELVAQVSQTVRTTYILPRLPHFLLSSHTLLFFYQLLAKYNALLTFAKHTRWRLLRHRCH